MLNDPLPVALDVRKAAARGAAIRGVLAPAELQRFRALLAADAGRIEARLACSRDEQRRFLIHADIAAEVVVTCQRCLEPMEQHVQCDNLLAVVWSDTEAAALPRRLDPLIVPEQSCNLHALVEEELMLSLAPFNYHDADDCRDKVAVYADAAPDSGGEDAKPNPFNVLAQLKPGENR